MVEFSVQLAMDALQKDVEGAVVSLASELTKNLAAATPIKTGY